MTLILKQSLLSFINNNGAVAIPAQLESSWKRNQLKNGTLMLQITLPNLIFDVLESTALNI